MIDFRNGVIGDVNGCGGWNLCLMIIFVVVIEDVINVNCVIKYIGG